MISGKELRFKGLWVYLNVLVKQTL